MVLPTARVLVHGAHGSVLATLLFDTGSDRTYVSEELVKKVGATWLCSKSVSYAVFGGGKSTCERAVRGLRVSGANLSKHVECLLTVVKVPVICPPPCSDPSVLVWRDLLWTPMDYTAAGSVSCQLLTVGDLHEDAVRNLWNLEGIGIRSDEEPASSKVLENFESSGRFTDGRYEVALPWKQVDHAPEALSSRVTFRSRGAASSV